MNEKMKVARIYYQWWGLNFHDKQWTLLDPDGEVFDYASKKHCIEEAKKMGWKYRVERHHRKERGKMTIVEKNY